MPNQELRAYQQRMVEAIGHYNSIVKMPTGSGKTVVAAQVVVNSLQHQNDKALFLVPTQELVEQQAQVLKRWCHHIDILRFTGGMSDPSMVPTSKVCLVSTPKAFLLLKQRKQDFSLKNFKLVVFDEVHHMLKDHPYRHIAFEIKAIQESEQNANSIQVLGMSASLTYAVNDAAIVKTLNRLCREMKIVKMLSPSIEELMQGGYVSQHGRNVEIEQTADCPENVIPRRARKPHDMYGQFMRRVNSKKATDFVQDYLNVIAELEKRAKHENMQFESPLPNRKLSSWADYVSDPNSSQSSAVLTTLQHWYVGLRLLVQTWEEDEHLVLWWLQMNDALAVSMMDESRESFENIKKRANDSSNFLKMDRLRFHLKEKVQQKGASFRCLVFVQQRITAVILSYYINNDPVLRNSGITADFVAACNSNIAPGITVTKRMAKSSIGKFRSGAINVIVSTSVLEEVCQEMF